MKMPQGRPAKFCGAQNGRQGHEGERRLKLNAGVVMNDDVRNRETNLHLHEPLFHTRLTFARSGHKRIGSIPRRLSVFAATTALGVRGRHRFGSANANRIGQTQGQSRHNDYLPASFHKGQCSERIQKVNLGLAKTQNLPSLFSRYPQCSGYDLAKRAFSRRNYY